MLKNPNIYPHSFSGLFSTVFMKEILSVKQFTRGCCAFIGGKVVGLSAVAGYELWVMSCGLVRRGGL